MDIVEQLRLVPPRWSLTNQVHYEAANEIERLRQENAELVQVLKDLTSHDQTDRFISVVIPQPTGGK